MRSSSAWLRVTTAALPNTMPSEPGYFEGRFCAQDSYWTSDPNLVPQEISGDYFSGGGYRDLTDDGPASSDNTITFQLNLTECFQRAGGSLESGQIEFGATPAARGTDDLTDFTSQRGLTFHPVP